MEAYLRALEAGAGAQEVQRGQEGVDAAHSAVL